MKGRGPRPLDEGDTGHLLTVYSLLIQSLSYGGAKRDRTADLNTASVALSQLSYSPTKRMRIIGIYVPLVKYFYQQILINVIRDKYSRMCKFHKPLFATIAEAVVSAYSRSI